jgi:hypothetical protein
VWRYRKHARSKYCERDGKRDETKTSVRFTSAHSRPWMTKVRERNNMTIAWQPPKLLAEMFQNSVRIPTITLRPGSGSTSFRNER